MANALPDGARRSRFWLFAPFVVLLLAAMAWSVAWYLFRQRAADGLDALLEREARAGRKWTCADRAIGGYPFRIEVSCGALTLERGSTTANFGRVLTVTQVYQPRLLVAEVAGPLQAGDGDARVEARWRLLQASVHLRPGGLQRGSLVVHGPELRAFGLGAAEVGGSAERIEAHLRPDPGRFDQEGAYDVAVSAAGTKVPLLNEATGGDDPVDLGLDALITRAAAFAGRPAAVEFEVWRQTGGMLELTRLTLAKGPRRLEAKGILALDELHRPKGRLELSASGAEELVARLAGARIGGNGAGLLGAVVGSPKGDRTRPADPKLTQLPPLRLENGQVRLGPIPLPGVRLPPLY